MGSSRSLEGEESPLKITTGLESLQSPHCERLRGHCTWLLTSINPNEEPLAWACQQLERKLGESGPRTPDSIAWGIVKARIEAYSQLLGTTDQMHSSLVKAIGVTSVCDSQILRFRAQVSRLKHENTRALEAVGEGQEAPDGVQTC